MYKLLITLGAVFAGCVAAGYAKKSIDNKEEKPVITEDGDVTDIQEA